MTFAGGVLAAAGGSAGGPVANLAARGVSPLWSGHGLRAGLASRGGVPVTVDSVRGLTGSSGAAGATPESDSLARAGCGAGVAVTVPSAGGTSGAPAARAGAAAPCARGAAVASLRAGGVSVC
jgi:hypothetical protein